MTENIPNFLRNLSGNDSPKDGLGGAVQEDLSQMAQFSIDELRPMKVIAIGAGFTGVAAAIRYV